MEDTLSNWTVVQTIMFLLTLASVSLSLYTQYVANPRKEQSGAIKSTEQALNEFLISYAGQYVDLKNRLDHIDEKLKAVIAESYEYQEKQDKLHGDITRELQEITFKLQTINDKLNAYIEAKRAIG